MNAYTLTLTPFEVGFERAAAASRKLSAAAKFGLMFVGGPLLGLAFVIALPFAGAALIACYSARFMAARWTRVARYAKNVALFLAAPFVGLAYLLAFPFVGLGAVVCFAVKAARR